MKPISLACALSIAFISATPFVSPNEVEARRGCCSHHNGVCGCKCCDGSSLSDKCAPYYPNCGSETTVINITIPDEPLSQEEKSAEFHKIGKEAEEKGDHYKAVDYYTKAINSHKEGLYYEDRCKVYFYNLSNKQKAIPDCLKAIEFGRGYISHLALADIFLDQGMFDNAIIQANKATKIKKNSPIPYLTRASAYISKNMFEKAYQEKLSAIKLLNFNFEFTKDKPIVENWMPLIDVMKAKAEKTGSAEANYYAALFILIGTNYKNELIKGLEYIEIPIEKKWMVTESLCIKGKLLTWTDRVAEAEDIWSSLREKKITCPKLPSP
ncbi:MAG: tetratricopeptide repeat protein [Candidatus Sericytochromatia bacterium]|nr:tetratricopeptide repeat protein [Candidatus Sericytochromatia bacterium]